MSGKNRLFKSGKTIRLRWDFCRSRISAGFGKSARFRPEPKSGTALAVGSQGPTIHTWQDYLTANTPSENTHWHNPTFNWWLGLDHMMDHGFGLYAIELTSWT